MSNITRISRQLELISQKNLDGLAITPGATLFYLTGLSMHSMERPVFLFLKPGEIPALVLPELEVEKAKNCGLNLQLFPYNEDIQTWPATIHNALDNQHLNQARIGIEPLRMRFFEIDLIHQASLKVSLVPASDTITALRLCKDQQEIDLMEKAVHIAEKGLLETLNNFKIGLTEKELASELVLQLFRAGSAPELPFSPIIASGSRSSNPHAVPSDRKILPGDILLIDWGATFDNYFSDLTRSFSIGQPKKEIQIIADIVLEANIAGVNAIKPSIRALEVDQAARQVIEDQGYGQYFMHRTGHGLGLEVHEEPYIHNKNEQILEPGMTFTIEPGIYLPGKGGIRIEENVVVTQTGCKRLSTLPLPLTIIE